MSPEPSKAASETGPLGTADLAQLPSKQTYAQFNHGGGGTYIGSFCAGSGAEVNKIKNILPQNGGNAEDYAKQIVWNYCYATSRETSNNGYGTWCQYFYYWLGDILIDKVQVSDSPLDRMKTIYEKLKGVHIVGKNGCEIIYERDNISKEIFNHVKTHFDYKQDHTKIETQLQKSNKKCTTEYLNHLKAITQACSAMSTYCPDGQEHENPKYCGEFNAGKEGESGGYCSTEKLQELQCQEVAEEIEVEVASGAAAGYNLLPSGIRNLFGNNDNNISRSSSNRSNRKKRSTMRDDFETLTTDTSTLYSTAEEASTIADSIADSTDVSTIYDRQHIKTRRTRTNNGRQQQQPQQGSQRNNIAYHPR
ncbi:KIR protein [Plasmodium coatneyi]|uniref:KIR protein n=1 Tax=Plasmodium coatneyi TaxID=208452 RepID=A0A1B1E2T1_9APIC|nr:KIR protein [Plasmodium coatneyi]ANQ09285.1 KIR protein [Plasmodium coatneyi]